MTELLTLNEYRAIAATLVLPDGAFIDGRAMSPQGEREAGIRPRGG